MTEAEWMVCDDPEPMLEFMAGKGSERKWRLFACACCRRVWRCFPDKRSQKAVLVAERFADSQASAEELKDALHAAWAVAENAAAYLASEDCLIIAWKSAWNAAESADDVEAALGAEHSAQCDLLRDIFGNPFRPAVLDPSWLAWHDGAGPKMAQAIYDERRFADLPILADALEDAGYTDAAIPAHCRVPGEHVRGCWVVDLLLGKS